MKNSCAMALSRWIGGCSMGDMSVRGTIDGAGLKRWARRSAATLEQRREEINALNVFPVPDSDTGSNMAATMSAAVAAVDQLDDEVTADQVAIALSTGAVRGARGNSGTVLSQVLRALAATARPGGICGEQVSDALTTAVDLVDRALAEPVEGTILTVLRQAAVAATANDSGDLASIVDDAATAARTALAETPSQLEALREAGVVDAGGAGLVVMLDALAEEVGAGAPPSPDIVSPERESRVVEQQITSGGGAVISPRNDDGELEVMFLMTISDDKVNRLSDAISSLGNSLVVGGDGQGNHMVHIHTTDAGAVIERALDFGRPSGIRIEILEQHHGSEDGEHTDRVVLAVIRPGQLADLFRNYGAVTVDPGDEPYDAVEYAIGRLDRGSEIILLPNGNVGYGDLEQLEHSSVIDDRELTVVDCSTVVHGMAAFAVHAPEVSLAADAYRMSLAASGVRAADVFRRTEAVSVVTIDGVDTVLNCDIPVAVAGAVDRLLESGGELVTLLLGDDTDPDCADLLRGHLREAAPTVELSTYSADGIGPRVLIGVE